MNKYLLSKKEPKSNLSKAKLIIKTLSDNRKNLLGIEPENLDLHEPEQIQNI